MAENASTPAADTQAASSKEAPVTAPENKEAPPTAPAPTSDKPVEDPRFASKFAALTRKERDIKQQEAALKSQLEELKRSKEAGEISNKELAELKELAKSKRMEVLRRLGISWEELSEEFLKGEEPPKKKEAWEERLESVNKRLEATEALLKAKEDAELSEKKSKEEEDYKRKLDAFYTGLEKTIEKEYPLVGLFNARDIVVQVIEQTWESSQKVLSNEEACKQVEEWFESTVGKAMSLEKVQKLAKTDSKPADSAKGKEGAPTKDPSAKQEDKKAESKGPSPTLGNKSGTPPAEKSIEDMDDEEKKIYLAAKLRKMRGK